MAKSNDSKNYQQLADELAQIFEWFESSQVNLDESIDKYEQAMKLIAQMEKQLQLAENKITKIKTSYDLG